MDIHIIDVSRQLYLKALWFDAGRWASGGTFAGQPVGVEAVSSALHVAAIEAAHPNLFNAGDDLEQP